MKATIESTTRVVTLVGDKKSLQARLWEGKTESGIPFHLYVTRVSLDPKEDQTQFQRELEECRAPSADVRAIPDRLIL
jgi:hypothetical protein